MVGGRAVLSAHHRFFYHRFLGHQLDLIGRICDNLVINRPLDAVRSRDTMTTVM